MASNFIYLASASPRRRELLEQIRVPFVVRVANIDESQLPDEAPDHYVLRLAAEKAAAVRASLDREGAPEAPVLAADTTVVLDAEMLGKPADQAEAMAMLQRLSGRRHQVLTGVALRFSGRTVQQLAKSEVEFRPITAAERRAYCATEEPFDKAGGYAIQGCGAVFVAGLHGSYSAVMGLPLFETASLLRSLGIPRWLEST